MTDEVEVRLAVIGSPIAHSLSPKLHQAAYRVLQLPWSYQAIDVAQTQLPSVMRGGWRGLSVTMPLKREIIPLLDEVDEETQLTGVANTVLFDEGKTHGFNTDIFGIVASLRQRGILGLRTAIILGGGATAASAVVALSRLGATSIQILARTPPRAAMLAELGSKIGVSVSIHDFESASSLATPDLVISTLPNGVAATVELPSSLRHDTTLFDVAYDPWPTPLATTWLDAGSTVVPGIAMLVNQALMQVRIFVSGRRSLPLPNEDTVLEAMLLSVQER